MNGPHLFQLVRRAATLYGDAPALFEGDRVVTWSETRDAIEAMAARLVTLGIRDGDRVAILAANSGRYIDALFAIPRIGAIAAPINTRLSPDEIAILVEDTGAAFMLVDEAFLSVAQALRDAGTVKQVVTLDASLDDIAPGTLPPEPSGDQVAYILYTGGSTGRSKGVMHTSATMIANVYQSAQVLGDTTDMRFLYVAPLFHIGALAYVVATAMHGAANVPLAAFDPAQMLATIERFRVTHTAAVPTMLSRVVEASSLGDHDISSLRRVIYGASPISESLLRHAMVSLPGAEFAQSYGQTETITLTLLLPDRHAVEGASSGKLKSAGTPTPGVDLKVVDEHGVEVATGELGEFIVRSAAIMAGYWQRPDATAETIRNGWLHTGDIGFVDEDGFATLVDRKKDMIISGGENISSVEVEDVLYRHPAVLECAVIGLADPDWGERVHAVVRLRPETMASDAELIAHCRTQLAGYKSPRSVTVTETPLPLSGAGKVLKRELRAMFNGQAGQA